MTSANAGVHAQIGGQQVFVQNGRALVVQCELEKNGFCLLNNQPMAVEPDVFEASPGSFGKPWIFRVTDSAHVEAVGVNGGDMGKHPIGRYYEDIAKAAKEACPEAEYVVIPGHITFSSDVSPFKQVGVLLGGAVVSGLQGLRSKVMSLSPFQRESRPEEAEGEDRAHEVPEFGAARDFIHADASPEQGAKDIASSLNSSHTSFPEDLLSGPSKQRQLLSLNLWRNLRPDSSIKNHHLAMMDSQTVTQEEFAASQFNNVFIGGHQQHRLAKVHAYHRLIYFPEMTQSEILAFKQGAYFIKRSSAGEGNYDVSPAARPQKNHILHTSFVDPTAPKDAVPRKSIVCAGVMVVMPETEKQARSNL